MKLGIRSLFQSIERLVELAKMVGKIIVNRVLWLSHMNIFKKIAIKAVSYTHLTLPTKRIV